MTTNDFQGAYTQSMAGGYPGMIATANARDAFTYSAEAGSIGFGLALGQGSGDRTAVVGGAGFVGISIADKSRAADQYAAGEAMSVLSKGTIWVTASTPVTPADAVAYDASGALGASLGNTITNARFMESAAAGALVRVHLT